MSHNKVDKSLGVNEKHAGIHGWMVKFVALVEVNRRNGESDFAVCTRLAPKLSAAPSVRVAWSPNYVHQILRGKLGASNRFWGAVKTLVEKNHIGSKKPRLSVPFESREEWNLGAGTCRHGKDGVSC